MEIIPEGKNFRLVQDDELPSILKVLEKHLPYALKVRLFTILLISMRLIMCAPKNVKSSVDGRRKYASASSIKLPSRSFYIFTSIQFTVHPRVSKAQTWVLVTFDIM